MISAICTKTFFEFLHILAVDLARHVTSQEDVSDNHFLPLDVAGTFVIACCFYEEVT